MHSDFESILVYSNAVRSMYFKLHSGFIVYRFSKVYRIGFVEYRVAVDVHFISRSNPAAYSECID